MSTSRGICRWWRCCPVFVLTIFVVACSGDDGGTFSCTARGFGTADGGARPPGVCVEAAGATAQDVDNNRQQCAAQNGVFATAPCSHDGAVGGCRVTHGGQAITTWYYGNDGTTSADVQKICAGLASVGVPDTTVEFVPP